MLISIDDSYASSPRRRTNQTLHHHRKSKMLYETFAVPLYARNWCPQNYRLADLPLTYCICSTDFRAKRETTRSLHWIEQSPWKEPWSLLKNISLRACLSSKVDHTLLLLNQRRWLGLGLGLGFLPLNLFLSVHSLLLSSFKWQEKSSIPPWLINCTVITAFEFCCSVDFHV